MGYGITALAALAPSLSQAIEFAKAPSPNLDLSNLGRIGIAGDFNGISLYEYEGQNGRPPPSNGSESLLGMLPNGALTSVVSTDASIRAMCTFRLSDGELQGVVIGGNFTSLDGTESTAVALYNPETGEITPLDGLEGEVNALYCDNDEDTVYVGGNFRGADSSNAISWYANDGWTNLPFAGFNGPVEAISKASNGHIIFGGSFTGLGNTSAPSEPDGQSINLSTANITAINSADSNGNPKNIVCSGDSDRGTWLVQDNTPGFWDAVFGFGFEPTKLRLWNTHQDGRGTKTFRLLAFPIDGIMNLTYIDPASGDNRTCTSECPLSDDPSIEFQDFHFINKVGMNRFQIAISEWYGAGAGLDGIQLFQDNIYSYAIADFNEPGCDSIDFPSTATATGPWRESPSLQSSSDYLSAELNADASSDSHRVVFFPNIRESGNYSVNMYTPGCQPDGTCEQRGRVNVTGTMSASRDNADFSTVLYQSNNYDKYDQIYFGYIEKTSDSFKPSVTLSPLADEDTDGQVVVAQRVGFSLINSTGGLNGLFDYDPSKAQIDASNFEDSALNELGASFDRNTGVKSLATSGELTFIGGNFTSDEHENIVAINQNENVRNLNGGLNGQVLGMHVEEDNLLYVGGDFTNTLSDDTSGLEHVAVYNVEDDSWSALGAGVNGRVQYVVPLQINSTNDDLETAIAFTGSFSEINAFGDYGTITANGLAIWVPSEDNWLQNIDSAAPSYTGKLTAAVLDLPDDQAVYAGSIISAQMGANGAVTLNDEGLGQFPLTLQSLPAVSSERERRDIFDDATISGVLTGLFYDEDDHNITILAGHFRARSTGGDTINNMVIIDGDDEDSISGLGDGVSEDSTFVTLEVAGSTLYAGGRISGNVDGTEISGIVAYDLESKSFGGQPSSISGGNGTVAAISARPDRDSEIFVGGSFTRAGALDCPGICLYNTDASQWIRPGSDVGGDVYCMMWSSKKTLVVGGDLEDADGPTSLAIYKPDDEAWEAFPSVEAIPGPVAVMTPGSNDNEQIWVAGSSRDDDSIFLMKYDGSDWHTVEHDLGSSTVIRSLQVFPTTEGHEDSDVLGDKEVLVLTGSIELPSFGMASAAIYNGSDFQPYAITTSSNDNPSSIAKIFSQKDNFFQSGNNNLALGFVVLIGLAISLAIILLMVVAGIILDRLRKKREGYTPAPTSMYDRGSGMKRIPPSELFQSLGRGKSPAPQL